MTLEKVETWQIGKQLAIEVYKLSALLPKQETFALSDQIRRSAISIPSNIAEGYGRESTKEYIQFLSYAKGSVMELKTQIILAKEIGFFSSASADPVLQLCDREFYMLASQIVSLNKKMKKI